MFLFGSWVNICFLFWMPVVPVSLHWYTLVQLSSGFCIFKFGAGKNLTKCGLLSELYCEWGWPGQPQILKSPYPEFASHYLKPALSIFSPFICMMMFTLLAKNQNLCLKYDPFDKPGGQQWPKGKAPSQTPKMAYKLPKTFFFFFGGGGCLKENFSSRPHLDLPWCKNYSIIILTWSVIVIIIITRATSL